ncbi:50S ribosomal protein L9 [Candidatus Atelocyanobacterium thalassae]|uniref:Large ribosomal subunit protein bL9 n=2 Tax=Candidatus Atelocyanobacterium thalassae TaxID=713887 RepID=A0A086CI05_9CHRO|nr:50S ribosomal protein L9 [Candidatus Atelocyanobacterium thalassa]KFF41819.1 MAG: LSU ribosomal protein L9P [Candidatus Atelocyanobacterium thalassa isolate SIO64986]BDA39388.1 50S ribosomal protein L9 [cyanobacterium endosymbiont of Braarudosphaera bigelowii]
MSKRVPMVLNKSISKLGKSGDLVEVAPGYARNYLLPQKLAVIATSSILKQVEQRKEKEAQRLLFVKQAAEEQKVSLETIKCFTINKQVGEGEAIFGTVTNQEVVEIIQKITNQEIDRRGVTLPEISQTGSYEATIKLHPEVIATIEIQVIPS